MAPLLRHRLGKGRLALYVLAGFSVGCVAGYIFMATVQAMIEIGIEKHHEDSQLPAAVEIVRPAGGAAAAVESKAVVTKAVASFPTKGDTIHTLVTSNGSPYLNFQNRIMYATYKLVQKQPGGEKMVGFTRILHRTKDDILVSEVPTFRADPLTPKCDNWCEFPVSDRPNAVAQFFRAAQKDPSMIKAPWLLMIETDYVWMKPLQVPMAEDRSKLSQAFPFGYINPQAPHLAGVIRKMYPEEKGPIANIPNSGPAPILARVDEWIRITPEWERLTAHIEADPQSKDLLGWVREMYAFSVASALVGVKLDLKLPPHNKLIVQPPADHKPGEAAMYHYTWGTIYKDPKGPKDAKVWEFDKRTYTDKIIESRTPHIPLPPPFKPGLVMQDGNTVTEDLTNILTEMIKQMNRGVDTLVNLT